MLPARGWTGVRLAALTPYRGREVRVATETLPRGATPTRRKRRLHQKDWAPYAFLAPLLFFFVVFFALPTGFALYLTFTRWNPLSTPKFIGLKNYTYLLTQDPTFYLTLKNTFVFAFGTVLVGVPVALVVAFVFTLSKGKTFWRSVYWLPMVTNVVAVAYIWQYLLDGTYGLVNRLLAVVGIGGPQWLTDPVSAMTAVVIVAVWTGLGQTCCFFRGFGRHRRKLLRGGAHRRGQHRADFLGRHLAAAAPDAAVRHHHQFYRRDGFVYPHPGVDRGRAGAKHQRHRALHVPNAFQDLRMGRGLGAGLYLVRAYFHRYAGCNCAFSAWRGRGVLR